MHYFQKYTKDEVAKIGNTLVYFAERISDLSKTKLLTLVYLLEETNIRKCARPFLNLSFVVWQYGPVAKDLFVDLSSFEQHLLKDYIQTNHDEDGRVYVVAKRSFDEDEFSDIELLLLDEVVQQFGDLSIKELVAKTNQSNSPWTLTAKHHNILDDLINERVVTTDYSIDFKSLLDEDQQRTYMQHVEYLEASRSL